MKLSICIPTYNELNLLRNIVNNIKEVTTVDYEICIIDDWWVDDTIDYLKTIREDNIKWKKRDNKWVTKTWNELVEMASWEYVLVINNDIILQKWYDLEMINVLEYDNDVYCMWPMTISWAEPFKWNANFKNYNICWWCWMIRKKDWLKIWPIDERVKIRYNDDYIFSTIHQTLRKKVAFSKDTIIHHYGSQTLNKIWWLGGKTAKDAIAFEQIKIEKNWL